MTKREAEEVVAKQAGLNLANKPRWKGIVMLLFSLCVAKELELSNREAKL